MFRKTLLIFILLFGMLCLFGIPAYFIKIVIASNNSTLAKQRELVYKISPAQVSADCNYIFNNKNLFHQNPNWNNIDPKDTSIPDPNDPKMPLSINKLSPKLIRILDDSVKLEFGGGDYHYGLIWFEKSASAYGTKDLGENLWFYAQDNKVPAR